MKTVRVSGVQMMVSPKLEENLPKILSCIEKSDTDFILFPEMSLTGYHGDFSQKAAAAAWRQVAAACRQAYVTALIGTGVHTAEGTFIQQRIKTDEGKLLGTHEKLVPTEGDRKFCRPGEELRLFTHHGIRFGCLICNDLWVTPGCGPYPDPRLAYQLGKRGAQIIFHAINSGFDQDFTAFHEANLALRARESKVYIVTANAADPERPVNAASGVVSPEGKWLVQCPRLGEQKFAIDIELEE
ncbi:MAG TPA: carbon-nitrogen hydrolase family protein [Candidatus Hydrogenedentes bacterium]|nr:carbon-nitrogen hydrolase family protein [Candidatus Hydrogenedentota bacterium]HPG65646.1 carbon-nitrogen hydrolase family protein [Candidatus Hydrogenedentota bacterium]